MEPDPPADKNADSATDTIDWQSVERELAGLQSVTFPVIHAERFPATPKELYTDLVRHVEAWDKNRRDSDIRRARRIAASEANRGNDADEDDSDGSDVDEREEQDEAKAERLFQKNWRSAPPHAPDPDGFVYRSAKAPNQRKLIVRDAEELLLDEMKTLHELHYDEVLRDKAVKSLAARAEKDEEAKLAEPKIRRSKVYMGIAEARLSQRHETFALPAAVKELLRSSNDEKSWKKAEELRRIVRNLADAEETLPFLSASDLERLAGAVEVGPGDGILGRGLTLAGRRLAKGAQVSLPFLEAGSGPADKKKRNKLTAKQEAAAIRKLQPDPELTLTVRRRPDTKPLSHFADLIWDSKPLRQVAKEWHSKAGEKEELLVGEVMDGLLLQLGLLLWFDQVQAPASPHRFDPAPPPPLLSRAPSPTKPYRHDRHLQPGSLRSQRTRVRPAADSLRHSPFRTIRLSFFHTRLPTSFPSLSRCLVPWQEHSGRRG
ncbi:MAG: hypothetical protein VXW31_07580, partial [Planctomycetota bacterium]|nr:hypothetical protein [Planctomycetota bacterium]